MRAEGYHGPINFKGSYEFLQFGEDGHIEMYTIDPITEQRVLSQTNVTQTQLIDVLKKLS